MGLWSTYKAQLTGIGRCCLNCGTALLVTAALGVLIGIILIIVSEKALNEGEQSKQTVLWIGIAILVAGFLVMFVSIFICCRICCMVRERERRGNRPHAFMEKIPPPPAGCYPAQPYDEMKSTAAGGAAGPAPAVQQSEPSAPPPSQP